jgi:hypothetical protein
MPAKDCDCFLFVCLFIFSLFYYAYSVTQTTQRRMKGREVNDELERILKEEVVAKF